MDVRLPSGLLIKGVPKGTSKEDIMKKAIAGGFATAEDFALPGDTPGEPTTTQFDIDQAAVEELRDGAFPGEPMLAGIGANFAKVIPNFKRLLSDDPETIKSAESELTQIEDFLDTLGEAHPSTAFSEAIAVGATLPASFTLGGAPAAIASKAPQIAAIASRYPKLAAIMKSLGYGVSGAAEMTSFADPEQDIEEQALTGAAISVGAPMAVKAAGFAGGKVIQHFKDKSALKDAVQKSIAEGSDDIATARYNIEGDKLAKDPQFKEAEAQGFDPGSLAVVKSATRSTKEKMINMVENLKAGKKSKRKEYVSRYTDEAGDSLMQRYKYVWDKNRQAGKSLDAEARKLKGKPVNFDEPVDNFIQRLDDDLGVTLDINLEPVFRGSIIEDIAPAERILKTVIKRMRKNYKNPDAFEVHRLKKFIDEHVNYGKNAEGLGGKTENILKGLRRDLDATLDKNFPDYNAVNTTYADTRTALDNLQDVAGKKMDLSAANASQTVGNMLRGLAGNSKGRGRLFNSIKELEEVSAKYGAKNEDNVLDLMIFADELETAFGTQAKKSLKGEMLAAGQELAETGLRPRLKAPGAVAKLIQKMRGINEENAFAAILDLLRSGDTRTEYVTKALSK